MLLINPATEQFGGFLSRFVPVGIPIAVGTLAAYLKKYGHNVRVADDEIEKIDENNLDKYIDGLDRPLVVGISVLTAQAARTYELIALIRKKYPEVIIILGGIHVTALPNEGIENGADFIVRGEGEVPLLRLYEALRTNNDWTNIESLTYRMRNGVIRNNPDGKLIENLDEIPIFPYELFQHPKYDMGFTTSSRGCPYRCTYCSQRLMTGLTFRYKSAPRVIEELDILVNRYGQKQILFYDDNFSYKKQRVIDLCNGMVDSGLSQKCEFFIQTRADNLYEDIMPYLAKANFTGVGFGMETAVERLAEVIVKGETVETHLKTVALARKYGMKVSLFMIFGLPTETHEDRMASYRLTQEIGLQYTKFNNLIPYPGTKLYKEVKDTPGIHVEPFWTNFNSTLTATRSLFNPSPLPYVPEGTTAWELKRDIFRSNMAFYFTPRTILNVLKGQKGPAFVKLPPRWYFKPREIFEMTKLVFILLSNWGAALLPIPIGEGLYTSVMAVRTWLTRDRVKEFNLPEAIDGTMREIQIDRAHRRKQALVTA